MRNNLCKLYDFRAIDNVDNCHKSNTGSKVSLNSKSNHPMRVIPNLALVNLATWSLKSTLYLVVILATVCRIPFAAIRLLKFHQETEKRKARDIVWSSSRSSKMFYFTSLPKELQLHILAFVDNQSLGRVSATTSSVYHLARDQFLWSKKLAIEYPDTSLCFSKRIEKSHTISMAFYENFQTSLGKNLASPFPVKVESPAYALFRIRYINNARCQGARKRYHATADSIHSILRQEADMGMESIATFLCLPFKAIGYSTIPVHYLCQNRNLSLQNSYHSCLRLFVMDLSRLSSRFFEFKKMHIFGLVNVMCAALWILDEIARACANINCLMMKLVTCQTFFKPLDFIWKLFWIPIMVTIFNIQGIARLIKLFILSRLPSICSSS